MDLARHRLHAQHLTRPTFDKPGEVVRWLGAVQAQDYPGAKWALGLRMQGATDDAIDRAFNEGAILRTHVMRPTWHFLTPDDIRWVLELTAPRVNAANAYYYRRLELDDALFARSNDALVRALEGGRQLTRAELGAALAEAGIPAEGMRLGYLVHRAELDAVVCSGARRGKQFTYALLEERAPHARTLARDEALAELIRRYYTGHGPATVKDFAWWSGLTVADVKAGLDMAGSQLGHEVIGGQSYWFSESTRPAHESSPEAFLLPTYDEIIIGYADRSAYFAAASTAPDLMPDTAARSAGLFEPSAGGNLVFDSTILIGGRIVGSWRRTFQRGTVVIEIAPFAPMTAAQREAVAAAARRFGEFLGMPVALP